MHPLPQADTDVAHKLAFIARKLDYTPPHLVILMPSFRWYSDYPNRERLLGLSYDAYRLLTGRPKASNF